MRLRFTQIVVLAVLALASLSLAQKTTLTVGVFPNLDDAIKAALPGFEAKYPNIEVKLTTLQYADHHNALTTALATGQGLNDVESIEIGFVGKFAEGQGFEDLNKAPYNAGQYKSLMTWSGYIAAGKKIKEATGAYLIADAADVAWINIFATVPQGQGIYFDKDGKVIVDSVRFVKAFQLAKQVRDAKLDAKIGAWSNEWYDAFKKGTVATQFSGAWLQGHLQNWMAPETKGLWRVQQLPDLQYASWGGSFYGIPVASKHKAEAWQFIKYLTTTKEAQIAAFKYMGAFPALLAAQDDPAFSEKVDFLGGQQARILWREAARKIKPVQANKYDRVANEIITTALGQVLNEGKDINAALSEAKALIERRMR